MENEKDEKNEVELIKLIGAKGSLFVGNASNKQEQIKNAVDDLKIILSGALVKNYMCDHVALLPSIARGCSIFLRKMVLGDKRGSESRLLNDEVCKNLGITFEKLKRIEKPRRNLTILDTALKGGELVFTRVDDGAQQSIPITPVEYKISSEWPLPGTQGFIKEIEENKCLKIDPRELFDHEAKQKLTCEKWLAQSVVLMNDKGINLKEIIRTVANTEGAHTVGIGRLSHPITEEKKFSSIRPEPHILNNINIFNIKYTHTILVMVALYILGKLETSNKLLLKLKLLSTPPNLHNLIEKHHKWLVYKGGGMVPLGHSETIREKYHIRSY